MRGFFNIFFLLLLGAVLVACGGPKDKEGEALKPGEQYVMTKNGLERVSFLKDKNGNKVDVGKDYTMTPTGLEPLVQVKDKFGKRVEIGGEYLVTLGGLEFIDSRKIRGTVVDADGKPVSGVDVAIAGSEFKAATDENGLFALPFVEGYVGFKLSSPNVPEWCGPENIDSEFVTREEHPKGWDVGAIKLHCISAGANGDKKVWATPDRSFVDNGDGTVTDLRNRLMWAAKVGEGDVAWGKAISYADGLKLGGYSDWRLPTREELETLSEAEVACEWHGPAVIGGALTVWSLDQSDPSSASIFNLCSGKSRDSRGMDEGEAVNPGALAVRVVGK